MGRRRRARTEPVGLGWLVFAGLLLLALPLALWASCRETREALPTFRQPPAGEEPPVGTHWCYDGPDAARVARPSGDPCGGEREGRVIRRRRRY